MSIKDMPHVTVEQVLALRKAAIELEGKLASHERLAAKGIYYTEEEWDHSVNLLVKKATKELERNIAYEKLKYKALILDNNIIEQELATLKASLPKIKADAVIVFCDWLLSEINWDVSHYGKKYTNKLEAGE